MWLTITALLSAMLQVGPPGQVQPEPNGIAERLQIVFSPSGEGQLALRKLSDKDFAGLAAMLRQQANLSVSSHPEIDALQGAVAFLAGQFKDSAELFGKAAALGPLKESDSFTLAMAFIKLGDDRQSAALLSGLSSKHPEQPLYLYWLGRIAYDLRLYPEAIARFQAAVKVDPKSSRAWDSLGLALDMQGSMEQAHQAFWQAVELNRLQSHPSPWPPHDMGSWCLRMDRLPEAEKALSEALRYDSHLARAHYHLARTLEKQAHLNQAVLEYKSAISDDPASPDAYYSLALLRRKLHQDEEANRMFAEYRLRRKAAEEANLSKSAEITRPGIAQ